MKQRVGFLGLGQMGRPMVRNLLRAGFEVTGFDPAPQAAESLQGESGFHTATSAVHAAQGVDVLILMLPSSQVIDDLLWNQGLTTHMKAGMMRRNGAPLSDQATMTLAATTSSSDAAVKISGVSLRAIQRSAGRSVARHRIELAPFFQSFIKKGELIAHQA